MTKYLKVLYFIAISLICSAVNISAADVFIVNDLGYLVTSENEVVLTNIYENDPGSEGLKWPFDDINGIYVYEGDIDVPSKVSYNGKEYTVTGVDDYVFCYFDNLGVVTLPSTVTSIGVEAFEGCVASKVIIPGTITSLGDYAFYDCQGLESISLDMTSISATAVFTKSSVSNVTFSNNVQEIGENAFEGTNLQNVVIPNSVVSIAVSAFRYCLSLKNVKLPANASYTTIKDGTFQGCSSLEKLVIPSNVTTIETEAFRDSKSLLFVKVESTTPPSLSKTAFKGADVTKVSLFIPAGTKDKYEADEVWKTFKSISDQPVVEVNISSEPASSATLAGDGFYFGEDNITLTATPDAKYNFVGWEYDESLGLIVAESEDAGVNKAEFTLTASIAEELMNNEADLNFTAKLEKKSFTITLTANNDEWGHFTNGESGKYEIDTKMTVVAEANDGYEFVNIVDENDVEVSSSYILNIDVQDNKTYKAVFKEKTAYTVNLTVNGDQYGEVQGLKAGGRYLEGQQLMLTAVAGEHSTFKGWTVDGADEGTNIVYTVDDVMKNYEIEATFEQDPTYIIKVETNMTDASDLVVKEYSGLFKGDKQNLGFTTNLGYDFIEWQITPEGGEMKTSKDASQEVTVGEVNVTYKAIFQKHEYAIYADANNGVISTSSKSEAGKEVIVVLTPNEGYELDEVTTDVEGVTVADNKFIMPYSDIVITAVFKAKKYEVIIETVENGSAAAKETSVAYGAEAELTATAKEGYEFDKYTTVPSVAISADGKFTMPASNVTVTPVFKASEFNITVASGIENGNIMVASKATYGSEVTVMASPATDYKLKEVVVDGSAVEVTTVGENMVKFNMPARDVEVSAVFVSIEDYTINVITDGNGSAYPSVDATKAGESVTISVDPKNGYVLDEITTDVEGVTVGASKTFKMPASDITINVTFKAIEFNVNKVCGSNGTLTVSPEKAIVGDEITVVATPNDGYKIDKLETSVAGLYIIDGKFKMPASEVSVTATFAELKSYAVTVKVDGGVGGSASVSASEALEGTKIKVKVTPEDGYELSDFSTNVSGVSVAPDSTFVMPESNIEVTVKFKTIEYAINKPEIKNGKLDISVLKAAVGSEIKLTATPNEGYELDKIYTDIDGLEIKDDKFVMPASDVTVTAEFKAINYEVSMVEAENGTFTVSKETAIIGDEIAVEVTPAEGYELDQITTTPALKVGADGKFVMPAADVEVAVSFKAIIYKVSVADAKNGKVVVSAETANIGNEITITATPDEEYKIASVAASKADTAVVAVAENMFKMPASDVVVKVEFVEIERYAIEVSNDGNGMATASAENAKAGETIVLEPVANAGYEFEAWAAEGIEISDNQFVMPAADVKIGVTFKAIIYNVAAFVENGTATVSAEKAIIGDSISIAVTPDAGYQVASISTDVEGVVVKDNKFAMPAADVKVTVALEPIEYTISKGEEVNGTITLSTEKAIMNETVTVTAEANDGYEVESITADAGVEVGMDGKFTMPIGNVTVNAKFHKLAPIATLYDWIIMVDLNSLEADSVVSSNNVEWYRVSGEKDSWDRGVQSEKGGLDQKISTGYYFTQDQSLIGTGDYYAVIRVNGKVISSNTVEYSSNKNLALTPNAVRHGEVMVLRGLPSADATVKVFDMNGKQLKAVKTDGAESMTIEAESVSGVYIVNVTAGDFMKSIKYVVK